MESQEQDKKNVAEIGSISHGTMRLEDLIPTFMAEIEHLNASPTDLTSAIRERIDFSKDEDNSYDYYTTEEARYDLVALYDELEEFAPDYCYFGAHVGDGADYGFWICEGVEQMVKDDGGFIVGDLSELDDKIEEDGCAGGSVPVLDINDHGNCALYTVDLATKELTEIWSI